MVQEFDLPQEIIDRKVGLSPQQCGNLSYAVFFARFCWIAVL
jgi:hypothetical protein